MNTIAAHRPHHMAAFFSTHDDDQLLLDDVNTNADDDNSRCWKCHGTGVLQTNPIEWLHSKLPEGTSEGGDNEALASQTLDDYQLEDSPLLNDDRIRQLSVKEFHCHAYTEKENNDNALKTLCIVSVFCFIFMLMEIVGGHIAGSVAVMTDAAHLFSDIIGFLVSIISIWISRKPKTLKMTFGFYRVEVLGAFISVLIVWLLAGIFCYIAIDRIVRNDLDIEADTMLVVATFGVIINIVMGGILHGTCMNTGHKHSHDNTELFAVGHNHSHSHSENINIRAAAAHVIGDFLQSIGVLLAAVVIKCYPAAAIADPICTVLFSVIIVIVTYKVARDSLLVLVEAAPGDTQVLATELRAISGVKHVHSLHSWCLAPGKEAIAVHIAVGDNCDRDVVLSQATTIIQHKVNALLCAVQVEHYDHQQMSICLECQQ